MGRGALPDAGSCYRCQTDSPRVNFTCPQLDTFTSDVITSRGGMTYERSEPWTVWAKRAEHCFKLFYLPDYSVIHRGTNTIQMTQGYVLWMKMTTDGCLSAMDGKILFRIIEKSMISILHVLSHFNSQYCILTLHMPFLDRFSCMRDDNLVEVETCRRNTRNICLYITDCTICWIK